MNEFSSKIPANIYSKTLKAWHQKEKTLNELGLSLNTLNKETKPFEKLIADIIIINCFLWHQEDKARARSFSDKLIANIKRTIDKTNQKRNDKMEEIDKYIMSCLESKKVKPGKSAKINSETPGAVADRLSITYLKIFHMGEQTKRKDAGREHIEKCRNKLSTLTEQYKDLSKCFDELIFDLFNGRKRLKMYYQFKMYNDPSTNPYMKK
jgi:hypothetical protein